MIAEMTSAHLCLFSIVCFFFLVFDVTVEAVTTCYNYESCRDQTISGEYMYCYSELACADSLLLNGCCSSNRARDCMGDYACSNSNWYNASWFGAYSPFTLYNTTIYNSGVTLNSWILGYYAAYNTTIYCYNSSSCSVTCNGNACINFNLICDDTSTCAIGGTRLYVSISNGESYYRGGLPMMNAISESSIVSDAYNGGKNCNNYLGNCDYTTLTISQSFYNIYCKAYRACYNSNININNGQNNSGVYCSAHNSCYGTTMKVINSGNGDSNNNNNNNTAYCGSAYSCIDSKFVGFNKIYGMGYTALQNTIIISNGNNNEMNVYFASYYAGGTGAKIYCNFTDTCNIYCDAYYSCSSVTAYCFGTCNVYCNSAINGGCLTVYDDYTQSPTNEPTLNPITLDPTTEPTIEPTFVPTVEPNDIETSEIMTSTVVNNNNNNNNNNNDHNTDDDSLASETASSNWDDWSKTWEIGGYVCLTLSLTVPIVINTLVYFYHKQEKFRYCDKPNYFAVFAAFWNFGDFYSDLIFTFVLITTNNILWYFAVFFALIPHFVSNFVSLWNIRKWQNYNIYIAKYINRYDWVIIFVSVLAGFYTSVELARSKIFYFEMFSMQLKNEDYANLQKLRFFNTVLLENVPQLVIQIMYTYQTGSVDIFVVSAMVFSILSALISISQQITRKMKHNNSSSNVAVDYGATKTFKLTIKCDNLERHHKYCHRTLTKAICSSLGIDNTGNIEVFYTIHVRNGIIAYIKVTNVDIESLDVAQDGDTNDDNNNNGHSGLSHIEPLFTKIFEISDNFSKITKSGDGMSSSSSMSSNDANDGNKNNKNKTNEMLKQEIVERLKLCIDGHGISSSSPGSFDADDNDNGLYIGDKMKIWIEEDKKGLEFDKNAHAAKKNKLEMSPIPPNSPSTNSVPQSPYLTRIASSEFEGNKSSHGNGAAIASGFPPINSNNFNFNNNPQLLTLSPNNNNINNNFNMNGIGQASLSPSASYRDGGMPFGSQYNTGVSGVEPPLPPSNDMMHQAIQMQQLQQQMQQLQQMQQFQQMSQWNNGGNGVAAAGGMNGFTMQNFNNFNNGNNNP